MYNSFVVPTAIPRNVKVSRSVNDATVLVVTWEPLTIVEAQGNIRYLVEGTSSMGSRKRQQNSLMQSVPANASMVMLTGANPGTSYTVVVTPVTSTGVKAQGKIATLYMLI